MKAEKKEFFDNEGNLVMARIWASCPVDKDALSAATIKLHTYVMNYVGRRGHNLYMHTEWDTVAFVITFDLNKYPGEIIEI